MTTTQTIPEAGAIVTWVSPDHKVKFSDLQDALENAGLKRELAKAMAPKNAFARSAKELSENRVIDRIPDDKCARQGLIKFQFTAKHLQGGELEYAKECTLYLKKDDGQITCDNEELRQAAERLLAQHLEQRLPADITRLIQSIFESQGGDLVPIRKQGGCYFVPFTHTALLNSVDKFMNSIGGSLDQWAIPKSSAETNNTIARNMSDYILGLIAQWRESMAIINERSSTAVLIRRMETAKEIRMKLKAYHSLLGGFSKQLEKELFDGEEHLVEQANAAATVAA